MVGDFMADFMGTRVSLAPPAWTGPEWQVQCHRCQCHCLALSEATFRVVAVRNLVLSPHVVTLLASARNWRDKKAKPRFARAFGCRHCHRHLPVRHSPRWC